MKYTGIDGCKAGWFYVGLNDNDSWDVGILHNISELSDFLYVSRQILIDIPIGLRESGSIERLCDLEARKALTLRKSSIFPAPCRQALECLSYIEACQVNFNVTGRKLSRQSWAISEKIKQVDDFLSKVNAEGKIHEFHPEVAFWALNNKIEMQYSKKTSEGFNQRLNLLSDYCPQTKDIVIKFMIDLKPKDVVKDDLLDALSGAVTAKYSASLSSFPEVPEKDSRGLAMEIVYSNGKIIT